MDELETLKAKIRACSTLDECLRLVGPSEAENEAAEYRLKRLDEIEKRCQWGEMFPSFSANLARETWKEIMAVQQEYESKYC